MEIYLAILAGCSGMLGWGLADFFAKKTVNRIGDFKTLLWAQIFGTVPIFIFFLFHCRESANLGANIVFLLFLFGASDVLAYLLFYRGLQKGMVSILSPIFAAQSGVSVLVSAFIFGETIGGMRWIGLAVVFIGIILVSFQYQKAGNSWNIKNISKGIPEVLAGMIIFGFFFPCWDWFLAYQGEGWIVSAAMQRFFVVIILLTSVCVISLIKKTRIDIKVGERKLWVWLVLIGLFDATAALITTWGYRFTTITSAVVVLSGAFPLPTIILARIFLKEKLTFNQIIGVIGIIGGLIILAI